MRFALVLGGKISSVGGGHLWRSPEARLSPYPGGSAECMCLVLPQRHRPSPSEKRVGFPLMSREHDFSRTPFRGCSYSFMFRPPSLLASQIVPTAASFPAGQPRLLRPSRTCVVTFARIGYALRPTTGNWRNEDFHLARFTALSTAPYSFLVGFLPPLLHTGLSRRTEIAFSLIDPEWVPILSLRKGLGVLKKSISSQ